MKYFLYKYIIIIFFFKKQEKNFKNIYINVLSNEIEIGTKHSI